MSTHNGSASVLRFVSRAEQLQLRGKRNFSRYMRVTKGFVDPDGPERAQWQRESAQESVCDADWNKQHGPVPGGASILQWRREGEQLARHLTTAEANSR